MGNLSTREKNILAGSGVLVLIFIAIQFIYLPAFDKRKDLERVLSVETTSLDNIRQLQKQYLSRVVDHKKLALETRQKGFTLFSFLDRQAAKSGVKKNIDYMKPFSQDLDNTPYEISKVKLKLKKIVLHEFINFIDGVETSVNGVQIISLSVTKTGKKEEFLDAVIEAQILMMKESV